MKKMRNHEIATLFLKNSFFKNEKNAFFEKNHKNDRSSLVKNRKKRDIKERISLVTKKHIANFKGQVKNGFHLKTIFLF
jgi:hypothetical protein